jgi:LPS sulfotransferase NodH
LGVAALAYLSGEARRQEGVLQLDLVAKALAPLGPPVIVFNASHSGSRLLAQLLRELGVYMGAHLNESEDSLDMFDLVRYLVECHAPDFSRLLEDGDPELPALVRAAVRAHVTGRASGQRWGWKLPETGHVLPVIARLFPQARCVHLLRDGRDVAFSPFVAPKANFWRKIYFNDGRICSWRGMGMTQRAYRAHGHLFNAARWVNSVTLGRAHGAMLGDRYLEVRYESLVRDPAAELTRLAAFLGMEAADVSVDIPIDPGSVGKWRRRSSRQVAEVRPLLEPTLASFGYEWETDPPRLCAKLFGARTAGQGSGVSAGADAEPGGLGGLFRVRGQR